MVYTGKPSRGCQTCKTRRIRCDEVRPACGNCRKSGRSCPGFPDEFDLLFRNENAAVVRRARRTAASKPRSSPSSSSTSKEPPPESQTNGQPDFILVPQSSNTFASNKVQVYPPDNCLVQASMCLQGFALPLGIQPSLETQATAFFFRNFVLPPHSECSQGFLDLLVPFYTTTSPTSALHLATHAVALSALGNYPGRSHALQDAAYVYGKALRKVGQALQDPVEAKSDETLLSIMLFSLYEVFQNHRSRLLRVVTASNIDEFKACAASKPESIKAWAHHVEGAVTLAKLRGTEQFRNQLSRKIFRAVRSLMLTGAIHACTPVEDFPSEPGWAIDEENAANRLTILSMGLPEIRARVETLISNTDHAARLVEAWDLIDAAKKIDSALQNWATNLSDHWSYKTVAMVYDLPEDVLNAERWIGPIHVYADLWASHILNDYRVSRIFIQSIIMMSCSIILSDGFNIQVKALLENACFITQTLVDEVCASVPFHMDFDLQNRSIEAGQDRDAAEALGGFLLVWHIFVSANVDCIPEKQREWLQGRMLYIGGELGIEQAQILLTLARRHALTGYSTTAFTTPPPSAIIRHAPMIAVGMSRLLLRSNMSGRQNADMGIESVAEAVCGSNDALALLSSH